MKNISNVFNKIFQYRIVRFFFVGTTSMIIDISINTSIVFILNIYPPIESFFANIISVSVAFIYNFTLSRKWTFQATKGNGKKQLTKFLILNVINLFTTSLLVAVLVFIIKNIIHVEDKSVIQTVSKLIVTAAYAVINYLIYKFWVFKEK